MGSINNLPTILSWFQLKTSSEQLVAMQAQFQYYSKDWQHLRHVQTDQAKRQQQITPKAQEVV